MMDIFLFIVYCSIVIFLGFIALLNINGNKIVFEDFNFDSVKESFIEGFHVVWAVLQIPLAITIFFLGLVFWKEVGNSYKKDII